MEKRGSFRIFHVRIVSILNESRNNDDIVLLDLCTFLDSFTMDLYCLIFGGCFTKFCIRHTHHGGDFFLHFFNKRLQESLSFSVEFRQIQFAHAENTDQAVLTVRDHFSKDRGDITAGINIKVDDRCIFLDFGYQSCTFLVQTFSIFLDRGLFPLDGGSFGFEIKGGKSYGGLDSQISESSEVASIGLGDLAVILINAFLQILHTFLQFRSFYRSFFFKFVVIFNCRRSVFQLNFQCCQFLVILKHWIDPQLKQCCDNSFFRSFMEQCISVFILISEVKLPAMLFHYREDLLVAYPTFHYGTMQFRTILNECKSHAAVLVPYFQGSFSLIVSEVDVYKLCQDRNTFRVRDFMEQRISVFILISEVKLPAMLFHYREDLLVAYPTFHYGTMQFRTILNECKSHAAVLVPYFQGSFSLIVSEVDVCELCQNWNAFRVRDFMQECVSSFIHAGEIKIFAIFADHGEEFCGIEFFQQNILLWF